MELNKYDLNAYSPEELIGIYVSKYAETFECTAEHAKEMFLSEFNEAHDFHNYKNVEDAIEMNVRLCGM